MFKWPHVHDIWNTYLTKFIERYVSPLCTPMIGSKMVGFFMQGGKKLERARDLFEQCLDSCPAKNSKGIFNFCVY